MTKQRVLVSWIGGNDLKAVSGGEAGPILSTLKAVPVDNVQLLARIPRSALSPILRGSASRSMCQSRRITKNCLPPFI